MSKNPLISDGKWRPSSLMENADKLSENVDVGVKNSQPKTPGRESLSRHFAERICSVIVTLLWRAKTPGGVPGENGSRRRSAGCSGAKCTRRAAAVPGGGKSRKRTAAGGRPRTLCSAGGTVGSVQGLSLRVDTLSTLSPMRSVKWCRERRMTM
jgi:hypothetical protein